MVQVDSEMIGLISDLQTLIKQRSASAKKQGLDNITEKRFGLGTNYNNGISRYAN
jgi:hypothetical protein